MRGAVDTRQRLPVVSPPAANQNAPAAPSPRRAAELVGLLSRRLGVVRGAAAILELMMTQRAAQPLDIDLGGPSRADLDRLHDLQLGHAALLERAIAALGGRPGARARPVAPASDVGSVIQGLELLLAGPLADSDGWMILADLTAEAGWHELAACFSRAVGEHDGQRATLSRWLRALGAPRQDRGVTTSR
jgi:hypothetical protein